MPRYFIEVAYRGTNYSGFQEQINANSIQAEVEKALQVFFKTSFVLTGSSRTDAGVHAWSNYFHFDSLFVFSPEQLARSVYNLNSILPADIVIKSLYNVADTAHCRFDALYREYEYYIYQSKNPFLSERAYFYPYKLDMHALNAAAELLLHYNDFTSFSKRNTQVKSFICNISKSGWIIKDGCIVYQVRANRFLRGMVKGLVGTMLRVGTNRIGINEFQAIIESKDCSTADFSVPARGLFLMEVQYASA